MISSADVSYRIGSLAGGVGRNETPPAFLIQRVGGFKCLTPLQVIRINHAPQIEQRGGNAQIS